MATYLIQWNAPTSRTDDSELLPSEIRGYIVKRTYNSVDTEYEAETSGFLLDSQSEPIGTITVAAVDIVGAMSVFAPASSVTLYNNLPVINTTVLTSMAIKVDASDIDSDSLTFTVLTQATKGVVTVVNSSTGIFRYTPTNGQVGTDSFVVRCSDSRALGTIDTPVTVGLTSWALSTTFKTINIARG